MKGIATALTMLGALILSTISIGSIGYGLYLWGGAGMAFSVAVWTAFKTWLIGAFTGITLFIIGITNR